MDLKGRELVLLKEYNNFGFTGPKIGLCGSTLGLFIASIYFLSFYVSPLVLRKLVSKQSTPHYNHFIIYF